MKQKLIIHALGIILIFICRTSFSADRYVSPPGGYGTNDAAGGYTNWLGAATNIQWAVDVAVNGETVWVTNGTYYLTNQIVINGKSILLQGVNGMEKTVINGNYPAYTNRCLYLNNTGAVVKGFTMMNAFGPPYSGGVAGGGVYMSVGTLRNCHITTNVGDWGGGIHIYASGAVGVYDCIISSNTAGLGVSNQGFGGGISILSTGAIISNCVFRRNVSGYRGGGIYISAASATENTAHTLINCTFISNSTAGPGAYNLGGAAVISGANNIIRNCLFIGNSGFNGDMGQVSGLIEMSAGNTKIQNCTFARNSGSGLYRFSSDGGLVENCIVASNSYTSSALTTNKNNRTDSTITLGVNTDNITNNPLFVNYAADNYRLSKNSPCINSGTNEDWMSGAVDMEGRMRIRYGVVDMGAYERVHEATIYRFY